MKIIQSAHPPELLQHTSLAPTAAIPSSVHQPKPPSSPILVPARSKNALFPTSNKLPPPIRKLDAIPNKRKTKRPGMHPKEVGNAANARTTTSEGERPARDATKRRLMKSKADQIT